MQRRILWVDDEIELLKAHLIFLEKKGYEMVPVNNGTDAVAMIRQESFDAVLLDEMMPGLDGLSVLEEIKLQDSTLPVIMVTKSQEEKIMDDALGARIDDYLIKPVNPNQIFTTLKRLLDTKQLRSERVSREYTKNAAQNRMEMMTGLDHDGWGQQFARLSTWDLEVESHNDQGLKQIHRDQKRDFRREFSRYVERNYTDWMAGNGPVMSHTFLDNYVAPLLEKEEKVYFLIIDCFRLDHWLAIEPKIEELFKIDRKYYYSILPTATPFSRNALFAGKTPEAISKIFPEIWAMAGHDETSLNLNEPQLMDLYLKKNPSLANIKHHYEKIITADGAHDLLRRLPNLRDKGLISIVYNFVDLLSHHMSENDLLQEIAPDEAAFRSLTRSWFSHSVLFEILQAIAKEGATVVVTTDHGSIVTEKPTVVRGDRSTSVNVRYKYGRNIHGDPAAVLRVENISDWGLPSLGNGTNYLFAKEEYYLIYQNNYRQYEKLYQNTYQHGGISPEEMILPVGILRAK